MTYESLAFNTSCRRKRFARTEESYTRNKELGDKRRATARERATIGLQFHPRAPISSTTVCGLAQSDQSTWIWAGICRSEFEKGDNGDLVFPAPSIPRNQWRILSAKKSVACGTWRYTCHWFETVLDPFRRISEQSIGFRGWPSNFKVKTVDIKKIANFYWIGWAFLVSLLIFALQSATKARD